MLKPTALFLPCFVISACAAEPTGDVCEQAIATLEECTGETLDYPVEGCVGSYQDAAHEIVAQGCAATGSEGRSDGWWCTPLTSWMGLCELHQPVSEAVAVVALDDVCPVARQDPLCDALHAAQGSSGASAASHYASAIDTVRDRLQLESRSAVLADPAVRFLVRERTVSLLVWNVVTRRGAEQDSSNYADRARTVLQEHFPHYDAARFHMAHTWLPPRAPEACAPQVLLLFPGVVRLPGRQEFGEQVAALRQAVPCLHAAHVNSGSFVAPPLNAQQARVALDDLDAMLGDDVPIHMVGYSQGAANALQTLVDYPEIAARVRSVLVMNSAAGGSEVGELGYNAMSAIDAGTSPCSGLPELFRPTCEWATGLSPRPAEFLLELIARAMGVPVDDLTDFIEAEDSVSVAQDLISFFFRHLAGLQSLTLASADAFWAQRGNQLPSHALYTSFASIITDEDRNLPTSNLAFFALLERAGDTVPYNDMQVRLPSQRLRAPIDTLEVRLPVAEGNHWQWALTPGAVAEAIMPREMAERIPQAELLAGYFQALHDVGIVDPQW